MQDFRLGSSADLTSFVGLLWSARFLWSRAAVCVQLAVTHLGPPSDSPMRAPVERYDPHIVNGLLQNPNRVGRLHDLEDGVAGLVIHLRDIALQLLELRVGKVILACPTLSVAPME